MLAQGALSASRLKNAVASSSHAVKQSEWLKSPTHTWSVELRIRDRSIIPTDFLLGASKHDSAWDLWFESGRGIEIGKKSPYLDARELATNSSRVLEVAVGEDLTRRKVSPSRILNLQYFPAELLKPNEQRAEERLLVRKTGIGIKAAVAPPGIAATQTIYSFKPTPTAPPYALHYAAGFLTSRVVIALHLAKTGLTEWRTHPYVTQQSIKELVLPLPRSGAETETIAKEIAALSVLLHSVEDSAADFELDLLVARLLGRDESLVNWSYEFLSSVTGCTYTSDLVSFLSSNPSAA